jgi:hypothetical protein
LGEAARRVSVWGGVLAGAGYSVAYAAGWGRERLWIAASEALAGAAGWSLGSATEAVTAMAVALAVLVAAAQWWRGGVVPRVGWVLLAGALSLTLAVVPGLCFVAWVALLVLGGWGGEGGRRGRWIALRLHSYPTLAAIGFLLFAPRYDVHGLTEAIVVAAGLALVARATVPPA